MPRRARNHPLRAWTIAAGLLLAVVVGLTWLATREEPLRFEEWLPVTRVTPTAPPAAVAAVATRVVQATVPPSTPTPRPRPTTTETEPPPEPTALRTAVRTAVPTARRTPVRPRRAIVPPVTAPTSRPPAIAPAEEEPPLARPRVEATEKPSLGSELQDATRAYRQAVDAHNARADEVERRNAWDDSEASVELRRRLDRARDGVESARVQAEMLRARMESVRTRYR
jgi:hypothetical protein